jgi:7,8-dihydropterin-6-yl-methyl-4-(beta-D-ribofuranosyl)aminobenzene 5'-phosphate synthase
MTQFMKLLLAGTITGVVMMTAAIGTAAAAGPENRITILYDAFGKDASMRKDWGFSALVEIAGKRILFDTGDDRDIFAANVKAKNVDLTKLDFVVLSHRHGDHMAGLAHVLSVNPTVKIYAPKEGFGIYGSSLPSSFYRKAEALPPDMRYFDGKPPEVMTFGSAWQGAHRQDDRNRSRHYPNRSCVRSSGHPGAQGTVACHQHAGRTLCWWLVARIPVSTRS